jgi:GNAT superfamily N-acetyltransferase
MGGDGHLTTGWEPGLPATDTITRAAIDNHVALVADPAPGTATLVTDRVAAGDQGSPSLFLNAGILRQPVVDGDDPVLADVDAFLAARPGGPGCLFSPWPTPDLTDRGWQLAGHPPLMVLPAGATAPSPPAALRVAEVGQGAEADDFGRVLVEGYPVTELQPYQPGSVFAAEAFRDGRRGWIGYEDDRAVAAAIGLEQDDVVGVHFVATLPDARGKGYGEALTWAAANPGLGRPSILVSSDLGRRVYERMGYLAIDRWTLWVVPRPV